MTTARYIVFEGGEGSGKSTQAARLATRIDAHLTFEPGATALGSELRAMLLDVGRATVGARAETLLMAADRAQHVVDVVEPVLGAGRHVVSDRCLYSSMAYQGGGSTARPRRRSLDQRVGGLGAPPPISSSSSTSRPNRLGRASGGPSIGWSSRGRSSTSESGRPIDRWRRTTPSDGSRSTGRRSPTSSPLPCGPKWRSGWTSREEPRRRRPDLERRDRSAGGHRPAPPGRLESGPRLPAARSTRCRHGPGRSGVRRSRPLGRARPRTNRTSPPARAQPATTPT